MDAATELITHLTLNDVVLVGAVCTAILAIIALSKKVWWLLEKVVNIVGFILLELLILPTLTLLGWLFRKIFRIPNY